MAVLPEEEAHMVKRFNPELSFAMSVACWAMGD